MNQTVSLNNNGPGGTNILLFGLASFALHIIVLTILAVFPTFELTQMELLGPVYKVDLVSLPEAIEPAAPPSEEPVSEVEPELPAAKPRQKPKPVEKTEAPKPAELIPLGKKKQTEEEEIITKIGTPKLSSKIYPVEPEKDLDETLARIQQKVNNKKAKNEELLRKKREEAHLSKALERARKAVADRVYSAGQSGGIAGDGSSTKVNPLAIYYTKVWNKIRQNWTLPTEWRNGNLQAIVLITVDREGVISNFRFEKKSGNPKFDQSVAWAIDRSNPLPALPEGTTVSSIEMGIRFRPED